jgi:hypothetical protein
MSTTLQGCFAILISLQCVLIVFHDLVDIPGWAHGSQVRAVIGRRKFWFGTAINAVFPGLAFFLVLRFWHAPASPFAYNYWFYYCAITVISAVAMWWLPYFFGTKEETKRLYKEMYTGTKQVLPARPNLLHLFFHALFFTNLCLALWLRFAPR